MNSKSSNAFKILAGAGIAAASAAAVAVFLTGPGYASKKKKEPFLYKNFAHRGLHSRDKKTPENSLAAFKAAVSAGYGVELDVQLSKDGYVCVFHDDDLKRVCGKEGKIWDYTLAELREMRLCGTSETIPLFEEVLSVMGGKAPVICELKTGPRNKELCGKTLALIKNYKGDICIESFDPTIVAWFRFRAPKLLRGQLSAPIDEYKDQGPALGFALSHCLLNFLSRPHFIAYKIGPRPLSVHLSEALGAMKVGWTSHDAKSEAKRDAVIFEFYRPGIKYR